MFERIKRFFRRVGRLVLPPAFVRVYVYEFVVYGVVYSFTDRTRMLIKKRYNERTLIQWECVFDEFLTLIPNSDEVERRYLPDVERELIPKLNSIVIANRMLTYQDEVSAEALLRLPLARYFKEWVRRQIEMGKTSVVWSGVCKLELRGVSAKLKEIIEVEEEEYKRRISLTAGKVIDEFRFGLIRPEEAEPFDVVHDTWEHEIV